MIANKLLIVNNFSETVFVGRRLNAAALLTMGCSTDIRYPTDLSLLNEAREKTEALIDHLYKGQESKTKKPRTYRRKASKQYLLIAKSRKAKTTQIRKAISQQLRYIRRNLSHIEQMKEGSELNAKEVKTLSVLEKTTSATAVHV